MGDTFRGRVELYRGHDGAFYWRIVSSNGETVAPSEGYTRRASARRMARKLAGALGVELIET